ncbi:MAG: FAD/NAD(P)-binding protein [archaeon]|nr:MAG: FAD/NAD(P)-binding protein [archaeon]
MNPYMPEMARIEKTRKETHDVKSFWFRMKNGRTLNFRPGQVIMVSVFGFGESTFGIIPTEIKGVYEFSVKKMGTVTEELFKLKSGDLIGIRGPFGNGYPMEKMKGKDIVIVGGGIGFPPLKSLILTLLKKRSMYGDIGIYYGARTPEDIVYKKDLKEWEGNGVKVRVTVDKGNGKWKGHVGVVTTILEDLRPGSLAFVCGPSVMLKFVAQKLRESGFKDRQIYVSMERLMQCGTGMCGHCNVGKVYVCKHGPVFGLDELKKLTEKIW